MDGWPPVVVEQFQDEATEDYRRRAARIVRIVTGFRMGHYEDRDIAELMERELLSLQDPNRVASPA